MVALLVISLTVNVAAVGCCLLQRWRQPNSAGVSTEGRAEEIYEQVDETELGTALNMKHNAAYEKCAQPTLQAALNMNQNEAYGKCVQPTSETV